MKIKALITLIANGKEIIPGSIVDLIDGEAQRLMDRGFAVESKGERRTSQPAKDKKTEVRSGDSFLESDGEDNVGNVAEKEGFYNE